MSAHKPTPRQLEVLRLLWDEGFCRKEVGERLGIAPQTVDMHIMKLREKSGKNSDWGCIKWALENGFLFARCKACGKVL